jgi:hypothetical protein
MIMRFRGGGVGHKSTRDVTDQFLVDRDPMDICLDQQEHSDDSEEEDVEPIMEDADGEENGLEEDYGYVDHYSDTDMEWEDVDDERFTNLQGLDSLGAEDGVDNTDLVEDLGFTEL